MHKRRRFIRQEEKTLGSQLMTLSLFVMLLAFFIVINAISTFQSNKVKPVMQSLGQTFASRLDVTIDERPSSTESEDASIGEGHVLERIEALFNAHIPGPDTKTTRNDINGTMTIIVPFDRFSQAMEAVAAGKSDAVFMPMIVGLMRSNEAGLAYRMDMTLALPMDPAAYLRTSPESMWSALRSLNKTALDLEKAGLASRFLTIGLQKGPPGTIELVFTRHRPYDPRGEGEAVP